MLRKDKEPVVEELTQILAGAQTLFVSDYRGLTVAQLTELRAQLRARGASLHVTKNTLARIAAQRAGRENVVSLLTGPTAITFCGDDLVGVAKALADFGRLHKELDVRGGVMQDRLIDAAAVKALATLPPRDVLIAQVVGTVAAPISGLVTVLQGTIGGFVRALNQVAEQRGAAA
jgi:large subunit ribosomal protein L10